MSLGAHRASSTREYQLLDKKTIDSTGSQSYSIIAGTLYLEIEMWGAGGGGGLGLGSAGRGGSTFQEGAGGGGGGYVKHKILESNLNAGRKLSFTIGVGGDGADLSGTNECKGDQGGATSYNGIQDSDGSELSSASVSAEGGCGGDSGNVGCVGGEICYNTGGAASGGNISNKGGYDGTDHGSVITNAVDGQNGGAAGGPGGGAGGDGGIDNSSSANAAGDDGVVPGGGGGGGASNCSICNTFEIGGDGGNGANGRVIIRAYG